ncbi:KpsF/GutQ family sugar-phosphate isomerase [Falsiroseomonas ponticola]|uniref:KpsF/GutQ family sugar-phosphate isomerase n=1 Tax=Falsiroseomonas ponticola TaxID=2786951 RepID=UPI00193169B9|nr:KpsF/GutQ family sugar-phosphate isomerase [Roseomonas ponticola]
MSPLDLADDNRLRGSLRRTAQLEADGLLALRDALDGKLGDTLMAAVRLMLSKSGHCVVTGMGKSGHVGRKIAATLASTGTPSHFVHPAEASHGDLGMIRPEDVILALSWSGAAPELASIIGYAHRFGVTLIAITSVPDSPLGAAADYPLILPRMPEACPNGLAPTTSTTMQLAVGDAFAMGLLEARGFSAADFRVFHPGGKLGAQLLRASDLMHTDMPLVPIGATLSDAIVTMTSRPFGTGGVVDAEGRLVGVLTDGDLRRAFRKGFVDRPVAETMTANPVVAAPDAMAPDLVAQMNDRRITSMFVVVDGIPKGVIHLHDLLRAGVV